MCKTNLVFVLLFDGLHVKLIIHHDVHFYNLQELRFISFEILDHLDFQGRIARGE